METKMDYMQLRMMEQQLISLKDEREAQCIAKHPNFKEWDLLDRLELDDGDNLLEGIYITLSNLFDVTEESYLKQMYYTDDPKNFPTRTHNKVLSRVYDALDEAKINFSIDDNVLEFYDEEDKEDAESIIANVNALGGDGIMTYGGVRKIALELNGFDYLDDGILHSPQYLLARQELLSIDKDVEGYEYEAKCTIRKAFFNHIVPSELLPLVNYYRTHLQ